MTLNNTARLVKTMPIDMCSEFYVLPQVNYEGLYLVSVKQLISRLLGIEGDFTDADIVKYIDDPSNSQIVKDLILTLQKAAKLEKESEN